MKKLASLFAAFGLALPLTMLTVGCEQGVEDQQEEVQEAEQEVQEEMHETDEAEQQLQEEQQKLGQEQLEQEQPNGEESGGALIPETETNPTDGAGGPEVPTTSPGEPE